jgi:hypothetical protein
MADVFDILVPCLDSSTLMRVSSQLDESQGRQVQK